LTFDVELDSFYLQGHRHFVENGQGYELYPRDWVVRAKKDRLNDQPQLSYLLTVARELCR